MVTARTYVVGNAALGHNADGSPIGIVEQHKIMKNATLSELVAVKIIIQSYYASDLFAGLMVDCYLAAKEKALKAA